MTRREVLGTIVTCIELYEIAAVIVVGGADRNSLMTIRKRRLGRRGVRSDVVLLRLLVEEQGSDTVLPE